MINWKTLNTHTPTNVNKSFPGSPETPFVSCIVWVCNPGAINGGVLDVVRWNTNLKEWHQSDMIRWIHQPPYRITHFCDDINVPGNGPVTQNYECIYYNGPVRHHYFLEAEGVEDAKRKFHLKYGDQFKLLDVNHL